MRRSEIFESFVKIAEEKGLVSKGSPESVKEELEKTHRADSLSIDDIAHLYGVKPDAPKDAQYTRNIVERAHPEPEVIAPSYDKLNGLVENVNERQDILLHIVNKTPNGQLTNHKYAERELLLSLVRVGNDMDNRGQTDLVSLADTCLYQAAHPSPFKKLAQLQLIIPLISAVVGGIYAKQHLRFHSDGFERDYQKAVAELNDLLNGNANWGVGYDFTPEFKARVSDILSHLSDLNTAVQSVTAQLDKIEAPHTRDELIELAKKPETGETWAAIQQFRKVVQENYAYLAQVVADFNNEGYKQRQIAQKGWITNLVDSTEILHGGYGLIADDFQDVAHALQTLFYDLKQIDQSLSGATSEAAAAQQKLTEYAQSPVSAPSENGAPPPAGETPALGAETAPSTPPSNPVQQSQADQLMKELGRSSWQDLVGQ